jgi:hypothetical protein
VDKEKRLVKVAFGIPNEGNTDPAAYDDRLSMSAHLGALEVLSWSGEHEFKGKHYDYPDDVKFEFSLISVGNVITPLARERIAESAKALGADYLFMVDDDMICPEDLFEKLYRHKVDIVAALAFSRYPPHKPVLYRINSGYDPMSNRDYFVNYVVFDYPRNTLVQCDAVGFGAVLIDMKVFDNLPQPWFMVMTGYGEDIHFCHSAIKAGHKVFMDTSVKLGHVGPPIIVTEEAYDSKHNQEALAKCN